MDRAFTDFQFLAQGLSVPLSRTHDTAEDAEYPAQPFALPHPAFAVGALLSIRFGAFFCHCLAGPTVRQSGCGIDLIRARRHLWVIVESSRFPSLRQLLEFRCPAVGNVFRHYRGMRHHDELKRMMPLSSLWHVFRFLRRFPNSALQ